VINDGSLYGSAPKQIRNHCSAQRLFDPPVLGQRNTSLTD